MAKVAEFAKSKGVPTVTYNTDVDTKAVPVTVMFDSYAVATELAKQVVEHLNTRGNVEGVIISLQGDAANDSDRARANGFKDHFDQYSGLKLITDYY